MYYMKHLYPHSKSTSSSSSVAPLSNYERPHSFFPLSIPVLRYLTPKYTRTPLIRTLVIWIGFALQVNLSRILRNNLAWTYRLWDQVQCSVMSSRTYNQLWSKRFRRRYIL